MRVAVYNPMTASWFGRWVAILTALASSQIVACPGTRHAPHPMQHKDSAVFSEAIKNYTVYHWPHGHPPYSNEATGVSIALGKTFSDVKAVEVHSPPKELQGRAGAVVTYSHKVTTATFCLYLPASGKVEEKRIIISKILRWAQSVFDTLSSRTHIYLFADANAKFGFEQNAEGQRQRQDPTVVGPMFVQSADVGGRLLVRFLRHNHLMILNSYVGGDPTYFGWNNSQSTPDIIAVKHHQFANLQRCETWKFTGLELQSSRYPRNRDHVPLVATFNWTPRALVFTQLPSWNREKLSSVKFFAADWKQVQTALENQILDKSLLEHFDALAASGKPDRLWKLLQEEVFQATAPLRKGKSEYKVPPSDKTQSLRKRRLEILSERAAAFVVVDLQSSRLPTLRAILRSWLWTVREQRIDKQLSFSRRCDRQKWQLWWEQELSFALARNDMRRAWYCGRKLAGRQCGPHQRFYGSVPESAPSLQDWEKFLANPGCLGGSLAKKVAEQPRQSNEIPFWKDLEDLAVRFPRGRDWKSRGGGRGSLWAADGSVPFQSAKWKSE